LGRKEEEEVVFEVIDASIEVVELEGGNAHNHNQIAKLSQVERLEEQGCRLLTELEVEVVLTEQEL
jgi:hypothetical protein